VRGAVRRRVFWKGSAAAFLGVAALTMLVVAALPLPPPAAAVLLLAGVCPGALLLVRKVRGRHGDVALGASLAIALTVLAIAALPLTLPLLDRLFGAAFRVPGAATLARIALTVIAAFAIGLAVRRRAPTAAARIAPWANALFLAAVVIVLLVIGGEALPLLFRSPISILAIALVTIGGAALGHWAGGPDERDRRTVAIASAFGNPALVLAIAQVSYPHADAVPIVGAYLILRVVALGLYLAWLGHRHLPHDRAARTGHRA
jgi:predicted Na+-dependent transporter